VKKLQCVVIVNSNSRHIQPMLAGFNILSRNKIITLMSAFPGNFYKYKGRAYPVEKLKVDDVHFDVVINETVIIHYDLSDSNHINEEALEQCDLYFKRSFNLDKVESIKSKVGQSICAKILPLGLYFLGVDNEFDCFSLSRSLKFSGLATTFKEVIKQLDKKNRFMYTPRLKFFEQIPILAKNPRVLFLAKVWDPNYDGEYQLSESDKIDRQEINEMRVNCIRLLKDNFGNSFTGGIERSDFSQQYCKELVIKDDKVTERSNYIRLMQAHDVCIATTGLHNSIGGKFAEYIASSKAIVTEPLFYKLPGALKDEDNYMEFSTIDGCITSVTKLMDDSDLRLKMMVNNYEYYHNYVRPDKQVHISLITAFKYYN